MYKNILILPDGTELSSGTGARNAIKNVRSTYMVNSGEEFTIGSACSNMIEVTLFTPGGGLNITAGDEIAHFKEDPDGERVKIGLFTVEEPTRPTPSTMKLTGYDRITKLDKDLTAWLESLTGWPYSVNAFAAMTCAACGVSFVEQESQPNADFPIRQWKKTGVTGRQIMHWLGEIVCRYVYADPDGAIRFGWYADSDKRYAPAGDDYFFSGSLSYENYQVAPVGAVQLRLADSESGALWPQVDDGANSYIITGNPILTSYVTEDLLLYLEGIAAELADVTYTPCEVSVPASMAVNAGDIVRITDKNGKCISAYVMSKITSGQRDTLSCTGSRRRDSASASNNKSEAEKRAEMEVIANSAANTAQSNAEKYAKENLENYAGEVSRNIENLQQQIDGQIQTWFDNYVPTASNAPASEWTTTDMKNAHLGDLFYIVENEEYNGMVYRWVLVGGVYKWSIVEDTEVAEALAKAAAAQDTADGKRRVFITTPKPPYDAGDLWAQGSGGDLMACKTSRASGSYSAADWGLASGYIDATKAGTISQSAADAAEKNAKSYADKAAAAAVSAQSQLDIFNKLSNNGAVKGLFFYGGEVFTNATYMVTGILASRDGGKTFYLDLDNGILRGKFTSTVTKEAYLPPTREDVLTMLWSLTFPDRFPPQDFYDLNGDGSFNRDDVLLANAVLHGLADMADCAGAIKTDVTVTIDPSNPEKTITISGTNMWGSMIETYFGACGTSLPAVRGDFAVAGDQRVAGSLTVGEYLPEDASGNTSELASKHLRIGGTDLAPVFSIDCSDGVPVPKYGNIDGCAIGDHITESSFAANFSYIKYASGYAVGWGQAQFDGVAITTAFGSLYESAGMTIAFPSAVNNAPYWCDLSVQDASLGVMLEVRDSATATASQKFFLVRGKSTESVDAIIGYRVAWYWK